MTPEKRKSLYAITRKVKANSKAMKEAWEDFKKLGEKDKTLFNQFSRIMFGKAQYAAGYAAGKNGTKAKSSGKKKNLKQKQGKKKVRKTFNYDDAAIEWYKDNNPGE